MEGMITEGGRRSNGSSGLGHTEMVLENDDYWRIYP